MPVKLSKKKALIQWNKVNGAEGYMVYAGSKKVKPLGTSKTSYIYSKSKAGSRKYKVVAYLKDGGKTNKTTSSLVKAKPNSKIFTRSIDPNDYDYMTCKFIVRKVSLSGKTYTVTGYAVNHRVFDLKKYKKLTVIIKSDGKVVAQKTYKNKKLKVKGLKKKKVVLKIKGKANQNIHYLGGWQTTVAPDWGF